MLFLCCSATQPKRIAGLAASKAAQEMNDDLVAAEAAQAALDVDINQLQVQSGCNVTRAVDACTASINLAGTA